MKKAMRKMIPAVIMLLISAMLVGTSTYAWFSMNREVTVTGMQVAVMSQETFLLIGEKSAVEADDRDTTAEQLAYLQTNNPTSATLSVTDTVYPCKPYDSSTDTAQAGYTHLTTSNPSITTVNSKATAEVPGNWFKAYNANPGQSTSSIIENSDEVLGSFNDYVVKQSFYLTLAKGASNAHQLKVSGKILPTVTLSTETATGNAESGKTYYSYSNGVYTKVENVEVGTTDVTGKYYKTTAAEDPDTIDISAVKVLIATTDKVVILSYSTNASDPQALYTVDFTLDDEHLTQVDVYIYYDGSAAAVTTNNKQKLGEAKVDLAFSVAVGSAPTV